MDLETENRIAAILMREAAELRRQAEKEGVHVYLRKPVVRGRPTSRFLTATVLGVQQEKILPVAQNQHLVLCTLLICNAAAMEGIPIFLDSLVTAWGAILISVTLILLFGEIWIGHRCSCGPSCSGSCLDLFSRSISNKQAVRLFC